MTNLMSYFCNITFSAHYIETLTIFLKNCSISILACLELVRFTHSIVQILIRFNLISVFKVDRSLVFIIKSVRL